MDQANLSHVLTHLWAELVVFWKYLELVVQSVVQSQHWSVLLGPPEGEVPCS